MGLGLIIYSFLRPLSKVVSCGIVKLLDVFFFFSLVHLSVSKKSATVVFSHYSTDLPG